MSHNIFNKEVDFIKTVYWGNYTSRSIFILSIFIAPHERDGLFNGVNKGVGLPGAGAAATWTDWSES